ncbi:MAG: site-2 protease family protein [Spirulinaceae cyanobacterium RM2_2_10]|nr:site-2 protease family protein [Spirulinaceae cyanobacterium RM2_2_10]
MFNGSETLIVSAIVLVALGILAWGYNRAQPYGQLGRLAWLQSVILMAPWLLFFGCFALGIYLNLAGIILLLLLSTGLYIYLGRRLRAAGQQELLRDRAAQRLAMSQAENSKPSPDEHPAADRNSEDTVEVPPIPEADLQVIRSIFGVDTFFATETISYQEGAIFKGNLRAEPEAAYEKLSEKLSEVVGDRYRLFLVENPDSKPVAIVLPSSNDPKPATLAQKNLTAVLFIATLATSLEAASNLLGFDWFSQLSRISEALPLALGLWLVIIAHEAGHWVLARRHHVRLMIPFFLPSWQIGSFGAITRFASQIPNRTALLDIALAGPAAGGIVSLLMLTVGLLLSQGDNIFTLPTQFFQGSVLVGTLAKVVLQSSLEDPIISVHPLVVLGWLGLTISALNLLPAGQLDGGRIVQAIYGRKTARRTTIGTLIVLGIVAIFNPANPIPLYWGILVLFLQRDLERPSLNELTEPDDARATLGLLALFLMLATLIPLSPSLAGQLGIGN